MGPAIGTQHARLGEGRASRRSVFTSCPNASRQRATHSLSVDDSIRIRGLQPGREEFAKPAGLRPHAVLEQFAVLGQMQTWLSFLWTSMPL